MIFSVKLEGLQASRDHLILIVREDGLQEISIFALPPLGTPITCLPEGQNITFPEPTYELEPEEYQFESHIFRYGYSSLRTPKSVYDYDMNTGKAVLKKMKPVCDCDFCSSCLTCVVHSCLLFVMDLNMGFSWDLKITSCRDCTKC